MPIARIVVPVVAMLVMVGPAWARQGLPASVADPYRAYQTAMEAGDAAAARDAARRALEAAATAGLDGETLGVLTENYAYSLAATGDDAAAMTYWDDAARLGERNDIARIDRAWRWYNAAASAWRAEDLSRARRRIGEATDLIDAFSAGERATADFMAEAWFLAARIEAQTGRPDRALIPAREALSLYEAANHPPDSGYAYMHYLAGLASASLTRVDDAIYHMHMARDIVAHVESSEVFITRVEAMYFYFEDSWVGLPWAMRDALVVDDRIAANPLHAAQFADWDHDEEEEDTRPGFVEPEPIHRRAPRYPRQAASNGQQGFVVARYAIEPDGRTSDIRIVDAIPQGVFDAVTVATIREWRYRPATMDGEPVRQDEVLTHLHFRLR